MLLVAMADAGVRCPMVHYGKRGRQARRTHSVLCGDKHSGMDDVICIETRELQKRFGDVWAVRGLSFHVDRGEIVGLLGALLTALYMTRLMGLTFWGESRVDPRLEKKIHEVPGTMKWVLVTLAFLSLVGGFLGFPGMHALDKWLEPTLSVATSAAGHAASAAAVAAEASSVAEHGGGEHHVSLALELGLMALSYQKFLKTLPEHVLAQLPESLRGIQVRQPWRWLVQFHYGEA